MRRSTIAIIGIFATAAVLISCASHPDDARQAAAHLTAGPWAITTTDAPVTHLADEIDDGAHSRIGYLRHRDEVHALEDIADPVYADLHADHPFIDNFDTTLAGSKGAILLRVRP